MKEYFTNPYNFVPLDKTCERSPLIIGDKHHFTGYFDCQLELLKPLLIPNTSWDQALCFQNEREAKHEKNYAKGFEFSSYEDLSKHAGEYTGKWTNPPKHPIVPGAEIRGSVRSVYEAAFNGCMSTVKGDMPLQRRSPQNKTPGILQKTSEGKWVVSKCERAMLYVDGLYEIPYRSGFGKKMPLEEYNELDEGQRIWIKLSKGYYIKKNHGQEKPIGIKVVEDYRKGVKQPGSDWKEGWIHKGEYGKNKHHESVFYIGESCEKEVSVEKEVSEEQVNLYKQVIAGYQEPKINKELDTKERTEGKHHGYRYAEANPDKRCTLIYYTEIEGSPYYLSPACIGKEVFSSKLESLLGENGGYQPCCARENLCPACKLFGMVSPKDAENGALGSRVRFTDATLVKPFESINYQNNYKVVKLFETAGPRPSAVEFYTKPPYTKNDPPYEENGYWTYDYRYVNKKKGIEKERLQSGLPEIRGRKFYWHSKQNVVENTENNGSIAMRQRMRALRKSAGHKERWFQFRVYFDRLDALEVERLLWSLDFADPACAHKIGHGKASGYGSTRIHIEALNLLVHNNGSGVLRLERIDKKRLYQVPRTAELNCNPDIIQTLRTMCSWDNCPDDVSYPGVRNKNNKILPAYEWFKLNKKGKGMQPLFSKVLPLPEEEINKSQNKLEWLIYDK